MQEEKERHTLRVRDAGEEEKKNMWTGGGEFNCGTRVEQPNVAMLMLVSDRVCRFLPHRTSYHSRVPICCAAVIPLSTIQRPQGPT